MRRRRRFYRDNENRRNDRFRRSDRNFDRSRYDRNRNDLEDNEGYYPDNFSPEFNDANFYGGSTVGYGRGYDDDLDYELYDGGDYRDAGSSRDRFESRGRGYGRRNRSDFYGDERYRNRRRRRRDFDRFDSYDRNRYERHDRDDRNYYGDYDYDYEDRGWFDRAADEVASWFGDDEAERRRRMDEYLDNHRGKGPKGYKRSDENIQEEVSQRFTDNSYLDASNIEVSTKNSEITLDGTVDSRYAKRLAEDIAEDVSGVDHVQNNLRVNRSWTDTEFDNSTTTQTTKSKSKTASGS